MFLQMALFHSFLWLRSIPLYLCTTSSLGFPGGANGKESAYQCRRCKGCRFDPWFGKIPWRRKWHPTPVTLPWKSHGQRIWWSIVYGLQKSQAWLCNWTHTPSLFFTHSPVNGHLACFYVWAIINSTAMNIGVHASFQIRVLSRYMPRVDIAGLFLV